MSVAATWEPRDYPERSLAAQHWKGAGRTQVASVCVSEILPMELRTRTLPAATIAVIAWKGLGALGSDNLGTPPSRFSPHPHRPKHCADDHTVFAQASGRLQFMRATSQN